MGHREMSLPSGPHLHFSKEYLCLETRVKGTGGKRKDMIPQIWREMCLAPFLFALCE